MLVSEIREWLNNFDDDLNITGGPLLEPISGEVLQPDSTIIDHDWEPVDDDDDDYDDDDDI